MRLSRFECSAITANRYCRIPRRAIMVSHPRDKSRPQRSAKILVAYRENMKAS